MRSGLLNIEYQVVVVVHQQLIDINRYLKRVVEIYAELTVNKKLSFRIVEQQR